MIRPIVSFVGVALVAACATVSDVTPIGKDTYMVGVEVRGGENWTKVKGRAIAQANQFCEGMGKRMQLDRTETSGSRGWTPQNAEISFMCLDESDPEFGRTRMRKEADVVIENH